MSNDQIKVIEQILERARHEVLAVVLAEPEQPKPAEVVRPDGMMGIVAACKYLECSEAHIRGMVRDKLVPERRVGNRLRFKADELDRATEVKARLKQVV